MDDIKTFSDICDLVGSNNVSTHRKTKTIFFNEQIKKMLSLEYPMIDIVWDNRYEILFLIKNNLKSPHVCKYKNCSNYVKFQSSCGYRNFCSNTCSRKNANADNTVVEKRKKTMIEKYGVDSVGKSKAIRDKIKQTNIEKYGVDNVLKLSDIRDKIKQTNIEKYGVEYAFQAEEVKEKIHQTMIEKYGHKTPIHNDQIKNKIKKTCTERYGVDNVWKSDKIKQNIKNTNIEKYGVENVLESTKIRDKIHQTMIKKYGHKIPIHNDQIKNKIKKTNIERHGSEYPNRKHFDNEYTELFSKDNVDVFKELLYEHGTYELAEMVNCHISNIHLNAKKHGIPLPPRSRSYQEQQLINLFEKYNINFVCNDRSIIAPMELDFYLPDHNIAIEINGVYWHSEKFIKDKNYHYNKWKHCQENGINLYSIFEDDLKYNEDMWVKKILHLCNLSKHDKIHARKCSIQEVSGKDAKDFLNKNHLQGNKFSSINLGLYYNDELVSIMSFSNTRNNNDGVVELTRFCNKMDTQVMGGASKLLSYFIKRYCDEFKEIISFSDNAYSDGSLYKTLGFNVHDDLKPDYKYVVNDRREHKSNYRKSKIQQKFNLDTEFTKNHTEKAIMDILGLYRIWDCGKKKWSMKI